MVNRSKAEAPCASGWRNWSGVLFGLAGFAFVSILLIGPWRFEPREGTVGVTLACLVGALLAQGLGCLAGLAWSGSQPAVAFWVVTAGLVARGILLPLEPMLSDDIFRYIWEGRIQTEGFNPYTIAPNDDRLEALRDDEIFPRINHPEISAIYPPVLQLAFWATASVSPTVTGFKVLSLLGDLATGFLLLAWLRCRGRHLAWAVLWWWSPLVIVEFAWSGHADSVGIAALVACCWALERAKCGQAVASLGLAISAKVLPILFVPLAWARFRWRVLWVVPIVGLLASIFLEGARWSREPGGLFFAIDQYGTHWRFNDALFRVPLELLESLSVWVRPDAHPGVHELFANVWARRLVGLLVVGVASWVARRGLEPVRAGLWVIGAFVLLTPTLHPWYLTWLIPWLCFRPAVSWWLLSGLILVSYRALVLREGGLGWREEPWVWWIQFVPFFLLLGIERFFWKRQTRSDPPPSFT